MMNDVDLAFATAVEQLDLLNSGEVRASELLQLYIDRVDRLNPDYNLVVALDRDRAAEVAAEIDRRRAAGLMAMVMLMRRMGNNATVHGFRSAFRDWAAESTSYAHEVCEMALAHVIGNKAEAAYRRGDLFEKRRRLMADWAAFCARNAAAGKKVTPIRELRGAAAG